MTEEEKKDLEYIKESPTSREIMLLRIISKLQEENKELREGKDTAENELKSQLEENKKLQADIEIKDKVIDDLCFAITHEEIPQEFYCHSTSINCEMVGGTIECKECLKQAVYEEVEKVGGEDE